MSEAGSDDRRWLDSAVRLARPWLGTTGGQPADAALVVEPEFGLVFGRGVTGEGGVPSAVTTALMEAGPTARGRTLYVTLEPGTEDTEDLIVAGIARVVVGILDPDLAWRGRGVARFDEMGIEAAIADHAPSATLHAAYIHRITYARPYVTARLAVSRDGMIGRRDGISVPLMGEATRRWLDLQRALSDAVMTSGRTAALDGDPPPAGLLGFEQRPFIRVLALGSTPQQAVPAPAPGTSLFLLTTEEAGESLQERATVIATPSRSGRPDLRKALAGLAEHDISSLFVEAGARLTEAMIAAEAVNRFHLIETPVEVGRDGLPATPLGGIEGRLRAAGFVEIEGRDLGPDRVRTYERQL